MVAHPHVWGPRLRDKILTQASELLTPSKISSRTTDPSKDTRRNKEMG